MRPRLFLELASWILCESVSKTVVLLGDVCCQCMLKKCCACASVYKCQLTLVSVLLVRYDMVVFALARYKTRTISPWCRGCADWSPAESGLQGIAQMRMFQKKIVDASGVLDEVVKCVIHVSVYCSSRSRAPVASGIPAIVNSVTFRELYHSSGYLGVALGTLYCSMACR